MMEPTERSNPPEQIIGTRKIIMRMADEYKKDNKTIVKFVPASGAASRMFKDLFEFLGGDSDVPAFRAQLWTGK